jgi:hypothetical protein
MSESSFAGLNGETGLHQEETKERRAEPYVNGTRKDERKEPFPRARREILEDTKVVAIRERALEWATVKNHGKVDFQHFLRALVECASDELSKAGVNDLSALSEKLLVEVDRLQLPPLSDEGEPVFDRGVVALFNHAAGFAGEASRDITQVTDLISALLRYLRRTDARSPAVMLIRQHWPKAREHRSELTEVLGKVAESYAILTGAVEREFREVKERLPLPRPRWWQKRLNVAALFLLVAIATALIGLGIAKEWLTVSSLLFKLSIG